MATLSIISTPIGNLEDITLRALKTLERADVILCEDTRVTKKLLDRHNIPYKKLLSYHAHSKLSKVEEIIDLLKAGENLALVSDAGTPGISDPGSELVRIIRERCGLGIVTSQKQSDNQDDILIEVIPGPSALTSALAVAGVPCADFLFLGFLPHKKGRETLFREIANSERTVIFYESPHRILKTLGSLKDDSLTGKKVTVCRELTKIYEEVISGTAYEVLGYFEINPDKVRGEFVVIVSNHATKNPSPEITTQECWG